MTTIGRYGQPQIVGTTTNTTAIASLSVQVYYECVSMANRSEPGEMDGMTMKRLSDRSLGGALVLTCALAAVGCSSDDHVAATQTPSAADSAGSKTPTDDPLGDKPIEQQWTTDALTNGFAAINARRGANPADYVKIDLTPAFLTIQAIDPTKRENVDEYRYDGQQIEVTPVDVSNNEPGVIEQASFKSDTLDPAVIAKDLTAALTDTAVEDGKETGAEITKFYADDPEPYLQVSVAGPRASKAAQYDLKGALKSVN